MSFDTHPWRVIEKGFDPRQMRIGESLTSIGNGYMGLRGNFEEDYTGDTHQGTYLGGVWFPDKTRVGWWKNGYPEYFGKVINAPNLIGIHVLIDGVPLDLARATVWEYIREIDMRTGVQHRRVMMDTRKGSIKLEAWRFVSLRTRELLALRYTLTPSFEADFELVPYIDGNVRNEDANYGECFWEMLDSEAEGNACAIKVRTIPNSFGTPRFTVGVAQESRAVSLERTEAVSESGYAATRYAAHVGENTELVVDKFVAVCTSRDMDEGLLVSRAQEIACDAAGSGWEAELEKQKEAWAERWAMADVTITGDDGAQQGIRFNLFQLLSTYSGEDARLNIGPKGFTGEKYGGATYWDTEAYCLPVYMAISGQRVARQLLLYRHQQLAEAFENARAQGLPGALFPMVTFTGRECHNEWEITFEEIHRNGAIAHAIFDYTEYTGDTSYLYGEGLDVLAGIARFWAGRVHFSKRAGRYMIHGVTGPNEYENNVNNNWYTNRIASWCIEYFLSAYDGADEERRLALALTPEEREKMEDIIRRMYYPEDRKAGIFVQHDTFLDKDLKPASEIPEEERPINQHWSWDHILRSCYIKQADVLQGLYFLNHLYSEKVIARNFAFYEPLTVHESSLSPCVHAILAAQIGDRDKAVEMYKRTARLDLDNINHDTADGLHITSMSGSWLAITKGFAGMRTVGGLSFAPFLPDCWEGYSFKFNYRGSILQVKVESGNATFTLLSGAPVELRVYGRKMKLRREKTVPLKS